MQLIFLEFGLWKPRVTPIIFLESRFGFHSTTGHIIIMASYRSPMNLDISEEERPEPTIELTTWSLFCYEECTLKMFLHK